MNRRKATGRDRPAVGPFFRSRPGTVMPLSRYRYPSDTSDLEWARLERFLPTSACQTPKGGAPEKWPRRRVIDAIRYITDNGTKWRALPADFGIPWRTVFGYFARWAKAASSGTSSASSVGGCG
ncbi:transposase [Streptomyces kaempferi]